MMLKIENFSKSYNQHLIVSANSITLDLGYYWIKGENGSGKTTFFRALAGLHPCEGTICFEDGIDLHRNPIAYRKRVNYSEAEPVFPGFLTGKDLFRFIGKAKGGTLEQQAYLINLFGIESYLEKSCDTYSTGMMKKLSLALAFLGSPNVIILDEPLITLDEAARKKLLDLTETCVRDMNITFLFSSHQAWEGEVYTKSTFVIKNKMISAV